MGVFLSNIAWIFMSWTRMKSSIDSQKKIALFIGTNRLSDSRAYLSDATIVTEEIASRGYCSARRVTGDYMQCSWW